MPGELTDTELLETRMRFLSDPGDLDRIAWGGNNPSRDPANDLREWRATIARHERHDELILWFEHDVFDQLNLIQLLSWVRDHLPAAKQVSLICIGSFPGHPGFKGLGELTPEELRSLLETRQPISDAQFELARRAWRAFREPTPEALDQLRRQNTSVLPYLAAAGERFGDIRQRRGPGDRDRAGWLLRTREARDANQSDGHAPRRVDRCRQRLRELSESPKRIPGIVNAANRSFPGGEVPPEPRSSAGDALPQRCQVIEIRVAELRQLFNAIDPSPFRERDLDPRAEEFIVDWARDLQMAKPWALVVHLDRPAGRPDEAAALREAIHEYFGQRVVASRRDLRELFRRGRISLVIALAFLTASIAVGDAVAGYLGDGRLGDIIREGFLIGGWVAMWRPLEVFLYDWWPIRAEGRLLQRLSTMPVRIEYKEAAPVDAWRSDWPEVAPADVPRGTPKQIDS